MSAALTEEFDPAALAALRAEFPALPARTEALLPQAVRFSLHQVKLDLLKARAAFEQGRRAPGADNFRDWLRASRGAYERWLARL
ncbi:MAG TPA: hypothetical protein VF538_09110 [Pyrinomonadaceae bacterium]